MILLFLDHSSGFLDGSDGQIHGGRRDCWGSFETILRTEVRFVAFFSFLLFFAEWVLVRMIRSNLGNKFIGIILHVWTAKGGVGECCKLKSQIWFLDVVV